MRKSIAALSTIGLLATGCPDSGGGGGAVDVTVLDEDGQPLQGATIYVSAADGSLVDDLLTDASGHASPSAVPDGGMITALRVDSFGDTVIDTIVGVKLGDDLVFTNGSDELGAEVSEPNIAFAAEHAAAEDYSIDAGSCETYALPGDGGADLTLFDACVNESSTFDVLALALDMDGQAIAYSLVENAPSSSATVNMPAWSTSLSEHSVTVTNAPPEASSLIVGGFLLEEGGDFDLPANFNGVPFASGSATGSVRAPASFGTSLSRSVIVTFGPSGIFGGNLSLLLENDPAKSASRSLDFTTDLMAPMQNVALTGTDRPALTWTGTVTADVSFFGAEWNSGANYVSWGITAPGTIAGSFTFPQLPAGVLPAVAPDYASVGFYDASFVTSYDDVRNGNVTEPTGPWSMRGAVASP